MTSTVPRGQTPQAVLAVAPANAKAPPMAVPRRRRLLRSLRITCWRSGLHRAPRLDDDAVDLVQERARKGGVVDDDHVLVVAFGGVCAEVERAEDGVAVV